jgi:hypothetical protein
MLETGVSSRKRKPFLWLSVAWPSWRDARSVDGQRKVAPPRKGHPRRRPKPRPPPKPDSSPHPPRLQPPPQPRFQGPSSSWSSSRVLRPWLLSRVLALTAPPAASLSLHPSFAFWVPFPLVGACVVVASPREEEEGAAAAEELFGGGGGGLRKGEVGGLSREEASLLDARERSARIARYTRHGALLERPRRLASTA